MTTCKQVVIESSLNKNYLFFFFSFICVLDV